MTTVFTITRNRCDWCGTTGLDSSEMIPGWYVSGFFVPMAGGRFTHCLDCYGAPAGFVLPVLAAAAEAIERGRQRRRREVQEEQ